MLRAVCANGSELTAEPQTIAPFESVWSVPAQLFSVFILMPPVCALIPAKVEVAVEPIAPTERFPPRIVEVPVDVASMVLAMRRSV